MADKKVDVMQYKLFDIQKNSFVDGPGIRTVVFFRGCNLRCQWCHNPESQSGEKHMFFYEEKCIKCGKCTNICKYDAINFGTVEDNKCVFCGECETICPGFALKQSGFEIDEEKILDEVLKDKQYYENSGGGVTFSGGECMLYPDELAIILKMCKENGIHTAVDTAGCVPWLNFEKVLPYTDLFLYDIKTLDNEKHKKYIGSGNEQILKNLRMLSQREANIWIRIPVIPNVNDNEIEKITTYAKQLSPLKIEQLQYHTLGETKYKALRMEHKMK